jgi:CubicO group peptidase (beta-lactamase class C family)
VKRPCPSIRSALLVFALGFLPAAAPAQPTSVDIPINHALEAIQAKSVLPGFCVAIVDASGVRYARGFGYANIAQQLPYTANTVQPIASVSKTLIAVSLMQSVEKGYFTLDTDVSAVVPFDVRNPRFPKIPITIRQLATHTSSIIDRDPFYGDSYFKGVQANFDIRDFLQSYLSPDGSAYSTGNFSNERPGVAYAYSNLGATVAALAVEAKAGTSYARFTRAHVLEPLHMDASGWSSLDTKGVVATLYDKHRMVIAPYSFPSYPDGGLYTSCNDLGKFLAAMISGYKGNPGILSASSFHEMFSAQFPKGGQPKNVTPGEGLDEGIIWQRSERGELGHSGGDPGVTTQIYFNPSTGMGRVLLSNMSDPDDDQKNMIQELDSIWNTLGKYEKSLESRGR